MHTIVTAASSGDISATQNQNRKSALFQHNGNFYRNAIVFINSNRSLPPVWKVHLAVQALRYIQFCNSLPAAMLSSLRVQKQHGLASSETFRAT